MIEKIEETPNTLQAVRGTVLVFLITAISWLFATTPIWSIGAEAYTNTSVLSSGKWVKIKVTESGIHQLSYTSLKEWGFSNPSNVKVYGYGGKGLSENFSLTYIDDLPQVATLHQESRLLFYAEGNISWEYNNGSFDHSRNPYSESGYYFITENENPNLELPQAPVTTIDTQEIVTEFTDYALHEKELTSIGHIGRNLYGEDFRYTTKQNFTFEIPGATDNSALIQVNFVAKTTTRTPVLVSINGSQLPNTCYMASTTEYYTQVLTCSTQESWESSASQESYTVGVEFPSGSHSSANLDYIQLQVNRKLQLYDGKVRFRSTSAIDNSVAYQITSGTESSVVVWDITNPQLPANITATTSGSNTTFAPSEIGLKEYIAFTPNASFSTPTLVGNVGNQNLHGLAQCDMVIITPPALTSQAQRLASFRNSNDGLQVVVASSEDIYNEFSSGTPDATAYRRFMKMFYDRSESIGTPPRYLLLLGDGIYDNREILPEVEALDIPFLLSFVEKSGEDKRQSFLTDDYFGFLTDNVGNKDGTDLERAVMQIAVGRIPARTSSEAKTVIDKIIAYSTNTDYGIWRNSVCMLADNGSADDYYSTIYMEQAEDIAEDIAPNFVVQRIYLDAYEQSTDATGNTFPLAKKRFFEILDEGTLVVNYLGHGGETHLTHDNILTYTDIQDKLYMNRLPLWITATCDFCKFDYLDETGAENILLNSKGGGIALYSTTRPVYTDKNKLLNETIIDQLFIKDSEGEYYTIGDVMRRAKSNYLKSFGSINPTTNHLNFVLLGDPSLKLNYPKQKANVTTINGASVHNDILPQLQANSLVTIEGEVLLNSGERDTNFNGVVTAQIFDSKTETTTLDNNNTGENFTYYDRTNKLYVGRDSIRNGSYSFSFRVPSETNFSNENGLINLYAYDENGAEANGYCEAFTVGGIDNSFDNQESSIAISHLYLNTSDFENGGSTNITPLFVAEVEADAGINISGSGIGHDITLTIDDKYHYTLNNYCELEIGSYTKGVVKYSIPELSRGEHTLTFKVWDNLNQSTKQELTFYVEQGYVPQISQIYAATNPDNVTFYIEHSQPNTLIEATIEIIDLMGRVVWRESQEGMSTLYSSFPITWYKCDNHNRPLPAGVYLYRAIISANGSKESTKTQKLILKSN